MSPAQRLKELLTRVRLSIPDRDFCGVGVVVYSSLDGLPIAPLCASADLPIGGDLAEQVAACSLSSSPCHDGFQLVSGAWVLTKRNQYFAPFPAHEGLKAPTVNGDVGSRHIAAKFGSMLDSVICTGVLSHRDGLMVFVRGVPVD